MAGLLAANLLCPGVAQAISRHPRPDIAKSLPEPEPQFPVEMDWTLGELNGKPVTGDPPSFRLDDKNRASGFSGCNTYSMTLYPGRQQRLLAGSIALTRKICDRSLMLVERQFLVGLHSAPTWAVQNGDLVIKAPAALMRFHRGL